MGSVLLTGVVIGSGVLATQLTSDMGVALVGNTLATSAILFVLVTSLGGVSGAHFNPAVTLVEALDRKLSIGDALLYVAVQIAGCIAGAWLAHLMFELPVIQLATTDRSGPGKLLAEGVATFALIFAIRGALRWRPEAVAASVALVIAAGYWWTASTSFANPAITIARALSNTFAGVHLSDAPGFIAAQFAGALIALFAKKILFPPAPSGASA
jgi:glycerol uptake facilitator-like aquaporin